MAENKESNLDLRPVVEEIRALKPSINSPVPNPAPVGLIAFGVTTALLQLKHTRIGGSSDDDMEGVDALVMGFGLFFGGAVQCIAGLGESKRNNLFGYTAFLLYGAFWMSLATAEIVQVWSPSPTGINPKAVQALFFLVGLYTTVLWFCTFKMHLTINLLFGFLATTLFILCAGVEHETVDKVGGYFGLITAFLAMYLAAVELVNEILFEGRGVIPLGPFNFACFQKKENKIVCETTALPTADTLNV